MYQWQPALHRATHKLSVMQVMEKVTESDYSSPLQGRLGLQRAHKGQEHV